MAEELKPNDTPEIAKLKACKTSDELNAKYEMIIFSHDYKFYGQEYKIELMDYVASKREELK